MIRTGHTAERAVDLIYRAYGANLSVRKIIKKRIADKNWRTSCIKICCCIVSFNG
jgi:hypothetical protein